MLKKNNSFFLINLGCKVNLVEINNISNNLIEKGYNQTKNIYEASIIIVNTCSVTNAAEAKSRNKINLAIKNKAIVIIMGCFSQLNYDFISKTNANIIIGNKYKNNIIDLIEEFKNNKKQIVKVENLLQENNFENISNNYFVENTRAFVKIQDGCDFFCSYCIIPFARGKQRSKNNVELIEEIKNLVKNNFKEIVLTGVNTAGYYINKKYSFINLLQDINNIEGDFRVRISSIEPFQISNEIIDLITSNKKRWCQHFHICLQSASDNVLRAMNRKYTWKQFETIINYIRSKNKLCALTTDYIVGFANETEEDFTLSVKRLEQIKFSDMHIFPYSVKKGTKAELIKNIVTPQVKKERFNIIYNLNKNNKENYLKQFINKKIEVIFENNFENNIISGYSSEFISCQLKTKKPVNNEKIKVIVSDINKGNLVVKYKKK